MKWIMKFNRAGDDPGGVGVFVRVECTEGEIQGEKERQTMRLEKATGRGWICTSIVPMPEKGGTS